MLVGATSLLNKRSFVGTQVHEETDTNIPYIILNVGTPLEKVLVPSGLSFIAKFKCDF